MLPKPLQEYPVGGYAKHNTHILTAVINGVAAGLSYIASQGNIAVTIVCTAYQSE